MIAYASNNVNKMSDKLDQSDHLNIFHAGHHGAGHVCVLMKYEH